VDVWIALLPVDCVELVDDAFFCCPGAFPEFPGAAPWEAVSVAGVIGAAALPLPLPFPARAEPVNAAMPRTSRVQLVIAAVRFVISSPRLEQQFVEGLTRKERTNKPYGYGLQRIFAWI